MQFSYFCGQNGKQWQFHMVQLNIYKKTAYGFTDEEVIAGYCVRRWAMDSTFL